MNLTDPTENGFVLVSAIQRTKVNGYFREGLQFEIPNVKRRDINAGLFKAWILPNQSKLLFEVPTMPGTMASDEEEREKTETRLNIFNLEARDGREVLKNKIIDEFPTRFQVIDLPGLADPKHWTKKDTFDDGSICLKLFGGFDEEVVQVGDLDMEVPFIVDQTYSIYWRIYFQDDHPEKVAREEEEEFNNDGAELLNELTGAYD